MSGLLIRNAEVDGRPGQDVRIEHGRIAEIGQGLHCAGQDIDARGGALIAGLVDHHIHLLATAALAGSLAVDDARGAEDFARRLRGRLTELARGEWLRVTGYHEHHCGPLSRGVLDAIAPEHPVRVQHQTGALWILNSRALDFVAGPSAPEVVERGPGGEPTGLVWRGDAWLQGRLARSPPPLAPLGAKLAAWGVTAVTDASATTDAAAAALLADAHRRAELPQRLRLMSADPLEAPHDGAFAVGPSKILLDDRDLPGVEDLAARIGRARRQGRRVAAHCVTAAELAVMLAAFEAAGAVAGDRIEHGGVIAPEAVGVIAALGLAVVTQPAFVFERGDRYLEEVDAGEQADLYRCRSLIEAGVAVAASSDAPYGSADPWSGMRAAVGRRTRTGRPLGLSERVSAAQALMLYQGPPHDPGARPGPIEPGRVADLCLLRTPLRAALESLGGDLVAATVIGGRLAHVGL